MTVLKGHGVGRSSFEENISTEADILIDEMKKHRASFDPKHLVGNAVSNIICSVVFGKRFEYTDQKFKRFLEATSNLLIQSGGGGLLELSPISVKLKILPFVRRYLDTIRRFYNSVRKQLEEHNQAPTRDVDIPQDLIDVFLKEKETKEKRGVATLAFQTENLLRIVADLFGAGSETTATTLRWSMLYMMAYPEIQKHIQNELDDITGRNRFPRISDRPNLPYTEAVLCEIQRMSTIVPLALPHMCSEDATLLG